MNVSEPTWSRARWVRVIAVLFAGQMFLVWVLAERTSRPVREAEPAAPLALLTFPSANQAVQNIPEVAGATLFALVDPRGFSGQAWLRSEPREMPMTEWKEPDFWLAPVADRLGLAFQRFIETNAPRLTTAALVPAFRPTPIQLPPAPIPTKSALAVQGELASRKVLNSPVLPIIPSPVPLRSTQVTVAVDASGFVFSAIVDRFSGEIITEQQTAADQQALELARQLRFAPLAQGRPTNAIGNGLAWGTVIFRWQTAAPAPVNNPPP